ncbi:hypothetical protein E4K67_01270 [Desulfosporosinus fructosivorans]|uniref:DUF5667 domain-containing protein n=1 Tax=Desulfosporosinus fructosivorans TaxID=2018669 RepID=A0A4Z0RCH0_9FIRM|nr:DUF5667 domain-containing protein [Desulfosporosinus fructosivorans]TGE39663.1 hypothetical protein E4K67_01270 [Desulfosporosinus fructosivorans]
MIKMKKQLAVAVTVAFLALPISSALAQTITPDTQVMVANTTTTVTATTVHEVAEEAVSAYEDAPITTLVEVAKAEGLKAAAVTAVAEVNDEDTNAAFELRIKNQATEIAKAKIALQVEAAETAISAYEAAPITTLVEVTKAEDLKAAAVTAVAAVSDEDTNAAFELRVKNQATEIATAKTALQVEAAEEAVSAYEAAPITTLAKIAKAEDLKATAVTAVAAVSDEDTNAAFELRIKNQATEIAKAKTALSAPVVDEDGNEILPATLFSDLINKLQLALTYDPARKGELNHRQALKKLSQAHQFVKDGNIEASEVCLNEYTDKIAKAQAFLLEVEDTDSETAKNLAIALANVEAKNIQVLGNLVDKLPPQAAQKLALNVVRTMEKAVDKIQKEEEKVALVTSVPKVETEKTIMDNETKAALEQFRKSVNEKRKIYIEDKDQNHQNDQDENVAKQTKPEQVKPEKPEMDRNSYQVNQSDKAHVTIVPVKAQMAPTVRSSDNNKDDLNKQGDRDKDNGGDNNRRDHK